MTQFTDIQTFRRWGAVVFLKTHELYGGLSNMAAGYPLVVNGARILTSEALYQACRFPHRPEVQKLIIEQASPMAAKMKSKPYRKDSRPDWEQVNVEIMRWCLRVKLAQNWERFGELLRSTGERPIIEESSRDSFWGAKATDAATLVGRNVLGRLLMELRDHLRGPDAEALRAVQPLLLPDFLFLGQPIGVIERPAIHPGAASARTAQPATQLTLEAYAATTADSAQPAAQRPPIVHSPPKEEPTMQPTIQPRKKLIEVALPLEAINKESAREKSIRHGHPSTLHLWWARRPLAACRAVLFASLVDDPASCPEEFPSEEAQEAERQRLFRVIEELVKWENSNNEPVLHKARTEIARSAARSQGVSLPHQMTPAEVAATLKRYAPPVLDPFAGGGSIPLEAQRLGLEAHASDLNPVAVLINKALIEIPPKFANRPPVHPEANQALLQREWRGAQGMAEDVRYYGKWMRDEAWKRIGYLYPKVTLPKEQGGGEATVIAWLWARTVKCPNPACGAQMPLIRSFAFSTKKGKEVYAEPIIDRATKTVRFEIRQGKGAPNGTINRQGANCLICGSPIPFDYIRAWGKADQISLQMLAIVAEGKSGRMYLSPSDRQVEIAKQARPRWKPEAELPQNPRNFNTPIYGLNTFDRLFTPRQLETLSVLSDLVNEVQNPILADILKAKSFHEGATPSKRSTDDAQAYTDAVKTYLGLGTSKVADYNSSLVIWSPTRDQAKGTFARQALPMVWDFAEVNPFAEAAGDLNVTLAGIAEAMERSLPATLASHASLFDATDAVKGIIEPLISTDPPYYNNISYAELSDYFYVWLRRSLSPLYPDLFSTLLVPKMREIVAAPYRFGGDKNKADKFFEEGLGKAFGQMREVQQRDYPLTVYYAFKQSESEDDADSTPGDGSQLNASTGWETMLEGLLKAGFAITGTWPMRTERSARTIGIGMNALASSIVLVCRPRPVDAPLTSRGEFLRALKRELPAALKDLQRGHIAPVDLAQAAIGPGMAVFSRYSKVLEADGAAMRVRTALQLINQALDEVLAEQEGEYDAETRWAVAWFEQFGLEEGQYGVAETLSKAKNTAVERLVEAGILSARGGKVRLLRREELADGWNPARQPRLTAWEVTQRLIKALLDEHGGGEQGAAAILDQVGDKGEIARDLAYRLYTTCERKGWAQEALAYNSLVVDWREIAGEAARLPVAEQAKLL